MLGLWSGGENHAQPIIGNPTGRKEDREARARVQPLRIIDHHHQRSLDGRRSQKRQPAGGNRQLVAALLDPFKGQGRGQRGTLHRRQQGHVLEDGSKETGQSRIRKMCFALDSDATKHGDIFGQRRDEMLQETRLATAGFTLDHDHAAVPRASPQNEVIESLQLGISS